jgi:cytochrome c-type biogenesis protein CcmE
MAWLPKSRKARRRLAVVVLAGAVLAVAAALALYALRDSVSFFYTPSQALEKAPPAGRVIQLGGLVKAGSVHRHADGSVEFVVADAKAETPVSYKGDLPDLFREGQGVVAKGAFDVAGDFQATQILAKHDERYMPREVEKALKETGEWRGGGAPAGYPASAAYETRR